VREKKYARQRYFRTLRKRTLFKPNVPCSESATSDLSDTRSTISIALPIRARSASKVAPWKQISKISKMSFSHFFLGPLESSIQRESSSDPYYQVILWPYTLGHTLSNALPIISLRHIHQARLGFKVAHKNAKSKKSTDGPDKTQKMLKIMFGSKFSVSARFCQ